MQRAQKPRYIQEAPTTKPMIKNQMIEYAAGVNWDSAENKETTLNWQEHIDIFHAAFPVWQEYSIPNEGKYERLLDLQKKLKAGSAKITITKGIHQRDEDPHIQFKCYEISGFFHLELAALPVHADRFKWEGVQITVENFKKNGVREIVSFPNNYRATRLPGRRNSISDISKNRWDAFNKNMENLQGAWAEIHKSKSTP
ncbi:hypothetical protein I5J54_00550 [Pseudomonas aeruginosa]|uniref:hypothetical protein n=1 Tax=Pseudomonas aeruginosa TaxID=287 RepID=UPI001A2C7A70|nr:hypothetical protein [Pseudomonas aeruginosa]MBH8748841.1 hypothetical protein [Pseudomonas aeruginosa]MBI7489071.1 hypothetical protein [Pseudomonas aeruginosa]MBI8289811.1 hypothetical protein [Pseudomonas aeruginosa]MBI8370075.1 hypothetical protein [Pseudomonas aeruginosa]MBI8667612.1 hypothetical protein [Pseudomonas aeruginosa]